MRDGALLCLHLEEVSYTEETKSKDTQFSRRVQTDAGQFMSMHCCHTYSVNPNLKKQISFNTFPSDFYNFVHQIVVSSCMETMMSAGQGDQVLF